MVATIDRQN